MGNWQNKHGANVKRSRRGGRRPHNNNNNGGGNGGGGGGGGFNPNRTFDSSGPEVKIRGSAAHVYEKYLQLARDANSSGDRITAENYLQHAEHYFRIMAAQQAQAAQYAAQQAAQNAGRPPMEGQPQMPQNGQQPPPGQQQAQPIPGSAPSFSLAEGGEGEEEGDEVEAS
jgi:hypothetical protein